MSTDAYKPVDAETPYDLWHLYAMMLQSRLFEEQVEVLWEAGHIFGEMHMGIGEEAIVAGVLDHLREGDALALDHRGTPPLVMRGVSARVIMAELLGRPDGLCRGQGGHMHLFAPEFLAASSGIVGASGPAATGFALAGQMQRPGSVAVAFFGEGALNQGMLLESFNLAAVWQLPVLYVCKDDGWAIFTRTETTSAVTPVQRAQGFGLTAVSVDGSDVTAVWGAAADLVQGMRGGNGPAFLHASCVRPHAHFLGDPLLRLVNGRRSLGLGELARAMVARQGDSLSGRLRNGIGLTQLMRQCAADRDFADRDPLQLTRGVLDDLDAQRLAQLEADVAAKVNGAVADAVAGWTTQGIGR